MTLSDHERTELNALLELLAQDLMDQVQLDRLQELVLRGPQGQGMYAEHLLLHAGLEWVSRDRHQAEAEPVAVPAPQPVSTPVIAQVFSRTAAAFRSPVLWSILTVAAVFYGVFAFISRDLRREPDAGDVATHAVVEKEQDVRLANQTTSGNNKQPKTGRVHQIESGVVEVKLESGVTLMVEGPAKWSIDGVNQATLDKGRVLAHVPGPAVGFSLQTPTTTIVDLGTEFGVEVDPERVEICVLEGEVSVHSGELPSAGQQSVRLAAGTSMVVTTRNAELQSTPSNLDQSNQYQRLKNLRRRPTEKFINAFWKRPDCLAYYDFVPDRDQPDRLVNRASTGGRFDGTIHGARLAAGSKVPESALYFDNDMWVDVDIPGELQQLTLVAVVRLDEKVQSPFTSLLMSNEWGQNGQVHWLFLNRKSLNCAVCPVGDHISPAVVQAERWFVTAAVFDTRAKQISMYLDGALVSELPMQWSRPLELGPLRIGNWRPSPSQADSRRGLMGSIDELMVFSRALEGKEIRQFQP